MTSDSPEENRNVSGETANEDFSEKNPDTSSAELRSADSRAATPRDDGNAASSDSPDPDDGPLSIVDHERKRDDSVSDLKPDDADDEVEPVELLVQLAEEGEIEPWDIDIVDVTDKFLARLDGADLRTSGRALFYA